MTTLAPFPPIFGPVEMTVPTGWRSAEAVRIDDLGVTWGTTRVEYEDITSVAYAVRERSLNLVQRQVCRRIVLSGRSESMEIRLGDSAIGPKRDVEHHHLYQTLVDVIHVRVEPRLRAELRRSVAAGRDVRIAGLTIGREGIRPDGGGRIIGWDRLPGAMFEAGAVTVRAAMHEHDDKPWTVSMLEPNAVLLPELIADCADVFA